MIVFRLTKSKYKEQLSGKGAELYGGRWNSKGYQIIYTCENRALCTTEIAVHTPLGIVPKNYFLQSIHIPTVKIQEVRLSDLPNNWKNFPHEIATQEIGSNFIESNKYLILKVPSAIVQDEFNYLINPNHKDFSKVKILDIDIFEFDRRMFDK